MLKHDYNDLTIFDERLREWAEANNIIPDSQNGFRAGHRTEDNCFILLPEHPDDVRLHGRAVSQAEQADDNIIMSTSFPAFQQKVTLFFRWCKKKRIFISVPKSKWMIFGPLPAILPVLLLGDLVVELVFEFKYVGIWLTSTTANKFSKNYAIKASKARNASNAAFALKHRIDVCLDVDNGLVAELVDAQHLYLRRLLGINSRSILAVLFTETGVMPLRVRRLLHYLGRLRYMADLGADSGRVVHSALLDTVDLFATRRAGWAGDVAIMLSRLPTPIRIAPTDFVSVDAIDAIIAKVAEVVDTDIDHLQKTHLLRNRLESVDGTLSLQIRKRRHYLMMVAVPAHRKSLTRLLLGDHTLSVERLRYPARYRRAIPHEERLCRLRRLEVEDEVHALLVCTASLQLTEMRERFLEDAFLRDDELEQSFSDLTRYEFLRRMSSRKAIERIARFIFEVLTLFDRFQRYIPDGYGVP
ncbi:hypothetical protein C8R47DRAFT_1283329 [Mycena vitilis]|nr:hypothetical protein C8R47DRAFT_1283329 [Mycena vitilis]